MTGAAATESCEKYEDPRIRRTRQLLVDSLLRVLSQKTLDSLTVQDITSEATVNRATFYAHFKDKYELLSYAMMKDSHAFLLQAFSVDSAMDRESLSALLASLIKYSSQSDRCGQNDARAPEGSYNQFRSLFEEALGKNLHHAIGYWLQKQAEQSPYIDEHLGLATQRSIASTIISAALMGAAKEWQNSEIKPDITEYSRAVVELLLDGLDHVAPNRTPELFTGAA